MQGHGGAWRSASRDVGARRAHRRMQGHARAQRGTERYRGMGCGGCSVVYVVVTRCSTVRVTRWMYSVCVGHQVDMYSVCGGHQEEMERFPLTLVTDPTAVTNEDRRDVYNNIFLLTVMEDDYKRSPTEMHIFQCVSHHVCTAICLSGHLAVRLSISLSVCLSVWLAVCPSVRPPARPPAISSCLISVCTSL